jgi:phospholipid/cholesterol/gamma-HCH transport system substrate-binding protein
MSERAAKLRLGAFVAVALAGLTGLAMLFGGAPRIFENRVRYTINFGEAPGVFPGTPVRKSGVRVGEVNKLDLDEQTGEVKITILVDKKHLPRQNEDATIYRGLLSGDTSLDFIPKIGPNGLPVSTRGEVYPVESEIRGQTPINPNQLVRQASGVLPTAQESMARILTSVQRFEQAVPRIEAAFDEIANLARSSRELVPELRRTNEKVQAILSFNDPVPPGPGGAPGALDGEGGLKTTLNEVREFIKSVKPLVDDIRKLVKDNEAEVNGTLKAVRKSAEGVSELVGKDENKQAVTKILKNIETATNDLVQSIRLAALFLDSGEKALKEVTNRMPAVDRVLSAAEGTMKAAESTVKSAQGAVKNIEIATKPIAENADQLTKNALVVSDQLARSLMEVRETLRMVNRADGTLNKVISDPALYNQLNESAISLTRTLMRAEKVAADLQVFSDKIARRPESLGVGGALRPNSGLKESPLAPSNERPIAPIGPVVPTYRTPSTTPNTMLRPTGDLPPN